MAYESRHRHRVEEHWSTPNLAANNHPYPPVSFNASASTIYDKPNVNLASATTLGRDITRTPSPTPSEKKELKTGAFDWETLGKWRFWIRKEWIWYYVALIILTTITVLVTLYHEDIVEWLTPATRWLHDLSFGWTVPIGILFVISFPPLFGHEIVAILCGLVWGLWIGFGIVSAGTFLGEVGNFYAFKWCCRARGEKMERTKITYACLAKVVRDGGFKIALIARLSAIPGHFTTAVFSTCGMGIIVFSLAAILSLPKQFITVYLGVMLEQSARGETDSKSRIISNVVLALTFIITIAAMWYIYRQMNKVKPEVIYERRKARQAKLAQGMASPYNFNHSSEVLPNTSEVHIPLTSPNPRYGTPSTIVYAPSPASAYEYKPSNNYGYSKSDEVDDLSSSDHSRQSAEGGWDAHPAPKTPPGIIPSPQPQYAAGDAYAYPPAPRTTQAAHPQTPTTARPGGYTVDSRYSSDLAYASPFEDPIYPRVDHRGRGHHEAEPTGMSYHTAREPSPPPTYAM